MASQVKAVLSVSGTNQNKSRIGMEVGGSRRSRHGSIVCDIPKLVATSHY